MTREELGQFDGREGRRALIAVNGKVYDVTASARWPAGLHEGEHAAGRDLTEELLLAPHVRAVIERFPVVDELQESEPAALAACRCWCFRCCWHWFWRSVWSTCC